MMTKEPMAEARESFEFSLQFETPANKTEPVLTANCASLQISSLRSWIINMGRSRPLGFCHAHTDHGNESIYVFGPRDGEKHSATLEQEASYFRTQNPPTGLGNVLTFFCCSGQSRTTAREMRHNVAPAKPLRRILTNAKTVMCTTSVAFFYLFF